MTGVVISAIPKHIASPLVVINTTSSLISILDAKKKEMIKSGKLDKYGKVNDNTPKDYIKENKTN